MQSLLGGCGAVHVCDRIRLSGRQRREVRLPDHDEIEPNVASRLGCRFDDLRRHGGLGKVREPHYQAPTLLRREQCADRLQVVAFQALFAHICQLLNHLPQVGAAAMRQHPLLYSTPIGQQADAVSRPQRDFGKTERSVHGVVELGKTGNSRRASAAGINDQPDRLAALDL